MVVIRPSPKSKFVRAVIKGAPEMVMPLCTKIVKDISGEEEILKVSEQNSILFDKIIETFCKD
jgi:magnesium-transporting ATPase (P-type)